MTVDRAAKLMLIATAALAVAACGDHDDRGAVRSETREVDSFDSIELEGAARLEIVIGAPESLIVEGEEELIAKVESDVRGDTLHIDAKPKRWFISNGRPRLKLKITLPRLDSLSVEGGNDVRLTGFSGGKSSIRAAGAAHIEADGYLEVLNVRMAGAGHADLSKLAADVAKVTVDGVGSVIVNPKDTLDATMNGVGAILYTGSPRKVNTRMNGLGTIGQSEPKDDEEAEPAEPDPRTLQPEYEGPAEPPKKKVQDSTEVI